MGSRETILNRIRQAKLDRREHPDSKLAHIEYSSPIYSFSENLKLAGGQSFILQKDSSLNHAITELYPQCQSILNLSRYPIQNQLDPMEIKKGQELENLDLCISPGKLGVAENGAVWVKHKDFVHRSALFICQHLVLILDQDEIVHSMHEAMTALEFKESGYGVFISGPSKTADIEQSLVIGAHGPRSCTVILI